MLLVRSEYELLSQLLAKLRRWPDIEANNLYPYDATDQLILSHANEVIKNSSPGQVATIGDNYGALTLGACYFGANLVKVFQDSIVAKESLNANATLLGEQGYPVSFQCRDIDVERLSDATIILMQLPKSLALLDFWARMIALYAAPNVKVFTGGRIKHMSPQMNTVLGKYFGNVRPSLAKKKSRLLIATDTDTDTVKPINSKEHIYSHYKDTDTGLELYSLPGVFSATKLDIGTRFLLANLRQLDIYSETKKAADLGCGNGVLAAWLLQNNPDIDVVATDISKLATLSAQKTLMENIKPPTDADPRYTYKVHWERGLSDQADNSLDLILCNPPFHSGSSLNLDMSEPLFRDAARCLRPGGKMITVFNSFLPQRRLLESLVGNTSQVSRNNKFTITQTIKR